jgi:hypothetical protein
MENYSTDVITYVTEWAESTEKIVGSAIKKANLTLSEPAARNISIQVIQQGLDSVGIKIYARDALRFVDMGAGRGWHKGKRVANTTTARSTPPSNRVKKIVWNKPIYARIQRLHEVVTASVVENAIETLKDSFLESHLGKLSNL